MIYIELLVIAAVICFIVDFSGFIQEMEGIIAKWMKMPFIHIPKPFSCSLCMTFWCGLLYIAICGAFTVLNIGYVVLLAAMAGNISKLMFLIKDAIDAFLNWIGNKLY